jgi:diguanylate cyclase (GGDEF)-like protein
MSTAPNNDQERSGLRPSKGPSGANRTDSILASFAKAMLSDPRRAAAIFWAGGVVAVLVSIPLGRWSFRTLIVLGILAGACGTALVIRVVVGRGLPFWTLHVDLAMSTVLISVGAAIGVTGHVAFADIYVWVALFAGLYFRPFGALVHVGGAGAAYALVLIFGPKVDNPLAAWVALFGTTVFTGVIVLALVGFLRLTNREDVLTGLANRRYWDERLTEELDRSRRTGASLSVAMIDIDGFKAVNDRLGHEAGDHLLVEVANAWKLVSRANGDFLARVGGDEFGVLASGADSLGIRRLSERLGDALPEGVFCSFGTATWDRIENASDLLRRADQAMYATKLRRRSGVGLGRAESGQPLRKHSQRVRRTQK